MEAIGHSISPSTELATKTVYQLNYELAEFESAEDLAHSFEKDKRKIRSGEIDRIEALTKRGAANRYLASFETILFYGLIPGLLFGEIFIFFAMFTLMFSVVAFVSDRKNRFTACYFALLSTGLSVPLLISDTVLELNTPYTIETHKQKDLSK